MKALIVLVILWGVFFVGKALVNQYKTSARGDSQEARSADPRKPAAGPLAGLPASLEASLDLAQKQGPTALKTWLDRNRRYIADPRLGAIELDYVVLVSRQDTAEARRVFQEVKSRTPPDSPLQERIKRLGRTYE